jgi:hypothetical protein
MGLILDFLSAPLPFVLDVHDDGLTTFVNMHMLNGDLLLTFAPITGNSRSQQNATCIPADRLGHRLSFVY